MENLDKAAPDATVEFDGGQRKLLYTMHSIAQVKRLTGKNLLRGELNLSDPEHIIALFWAALLNGMPELDGNIVDSKPDEAASKGLMRVGNWMSLDKLTAVSGAIAVAFKQAGGDVKSGAAEKK